MKTYNSPMLQVISISKSDMIVTSPILSGTYNGMEAIYAPGQRGLDDWDAGY